MKNACFCVTLVLASPFRLLSFAFVLNGGSRMSYLLAHDLGTTGNKASLFDRSGQLCASHLETYRVIYPHPQWAEQDPADWWRAVCDSTRALLRAVPDAKDNIAAVTFSGQMMGVVPVEQLSPPPSSCDYLG